MIGKKPKYLFDMTQKDLDFILSQLESNSPNSEYYIVGSVCRKEQDFPKDLDLVVVNEDLSHDVSRVRLRIEEYFGFKVDLFLMNDKAFTDCLNSSYLPPTYDLSKKRTINFIKNKATNFDVQGYIKDFGHRLNEGRFDNSRGLP